jgi:hypothetical protein
VNKGAINHLPRVRVLYSAGEVILALGDTEEVAHATNATWEAVKHWRKKNRIPLAYERQIKGLLASRRYATTPTLFGPVGRERAAQASASEVE